MSRPSAAPLTLCVLLACAEADPVDRGIDDAALADAGRTDWVAFGRTSDQQRYSPLTQVDASTIGRLAPAWYLDLPDDKGLVSTPLVVDGTLYFIGSMNRVRAADASRTKPWRWRPRPGPATGGSTVVVETRGTDSPTTPSSISSISARETDRRGIARSGAPTEATTSS